MNEYKRLANIFETNNIATDDIVTLMCNYFSSNTIKEFNDFMIDEGYINC